MPRLTIAVLLLLAGSALWACDDGTGVESGPDGIVGSWISAGYDLAPGVRDRFGGRDSVVAEFGEDGTWVTLEYSGGGRTLEESGVYELGDSVGRIRSITLLGDPPRLDTITLYAGIFRVTGDRLQLEVVRPWDFIPATVEGSFGSTRTLADSVETGPYWIQVYERRE